ncbi:MAG: amino acid adenylation domain-containing protein [Tildeniella torsiva UHER 1998/13D]|jgi:amino acid adenylation domain-containing protein/thioester reductase-like protein/non-ribosomal peptide synthase protein (TIGR01720 family)|nr:amino acid adenylation domain-containing protein [Tildeniella torsiva UHER 1998/13D]
MMQPTTLEGYRLSPQQARLWSLQQATPETPYQVQALIHLAGPLEPVRLITALRQLINRHEILRTTFQCLPGMTEPLQVIGASLSPDSEPDWWSCHDLTALEASAQAAALKCHWQALQQTTLSPQQVPIQAILIRQSEHESQLLLKLAGLCADAATLPRIVQELSHTYGASGEQGSGDEPIQYADLAEWQHELLESDETASGQNHWRQIALGRALAVRLPGRLRSHSTSQPFCPQTVSIQLPRALVRSLQAITQCANASLPSFLLVAWQVLLRRLTGQSELVVGTAFDGRHYDDLAGAIGPLTRYLPIHQVLSPEQSFAQVWAQVRTQLDTEAQWQDYFTWDLWQLKTEQAFFPFGFDYREAAPVRSTSDLTFELQQSWACVERYQVHLTCHHQADALTCEFEYDASDLSVDAVERLAEQYEVLLSQAIANPDSAISGLEILSPAARHQLLVEFNPTLPPPVQGCLHHRFEAQVAQTPEALAVVCDDQSLSYAQLNQRANQLAHFLQQQGVGVDTPVALYLERSCELMVGLLGIVKAGGAYLPLDPALPPAAIAQRIEHAQAPVILIQASLLDRLPATTAHVICLDRDWDAIAQHSSDNPSSSVTAAHLAYIIYTSGSTGQPKGVAVEHRHLLSYLDGIEQRLNLLPGASYASVSTVAADLGHTVLFSALCTGGCLHLISTERAANPEALAQYCQQHPIDCLKIVPSHLQALLASAADPAQILPQRCLVLGGEASDWSLIQTIQQLSDCRILNHYGPTEATVGVLAYEIEVIDVSGIVPLGRPLAHSQVYVLDEHQQPVPIGVPGELYIGGATVARGYWNQPDLTADRFLPNPFGTGKLYRTGDRVRYWPEGTLEFIGRLDEQVKLRGYRIELGEIEAVLAQHPVVQQSVVVLREDSPAQKRLVAYVVLNHATQKTEAVQEFLAQRLPDYMVPSAFVTLDALPLTPNGKIDRHALPIPENRAAQSAYTPPTTPAEKTLAQIWAQVLGLEQVGVDDNFFSLGGDSILSIQVVAKANQAGLSLTPKQLFDHQTIAALAAVAGSEVEVQAEQGVVTGAVPLTPIQHWFFDQAFEQPHYWNQAVLLDCRPALDPELLQQTVEHLLAHHDGLRSRFVGTASGWQQEVLPTSSMAPRVAEIDLSHLPDPEQTAAIEVEANRLQGSLDLEAGKVVRVVLFNLAANRSQRLLLIVHHLVIDGVSWRILLEDFQTVYEQLRLGQPAHLTPKTTAFQHWARQLQTYAQSPELHQELTIWQSHLQSVSPSIPVDVTEGSNAIASAQTLTVELTAVETQVLLQVVPQAEQAHINEVLLTALAQAFQPWTDQPVLLIDIEGHGREGLFSPVDLSRTVGWFTTVYPVCLPLQTTTWSATLAAIKAQFQQIPHHGLGYGVLRYLTTDSPIASLPQAQVKFNYLGQFDQVFAQSTLFQPSEASPGQTRSADNHRSHLIDVVGLVTDGKLFVTWTYSRHRHHESTIAALAQAFMAALRSRLVQGERASEGDRTLEQWHQDLQLEAAIQVHPDLIQPLAQPQQVLLTGASGFLGAFLLHELLQQTSAHVHCLVRAADNQSAQRRLQQHLQQYQLWHDDYASRIIPLAGDLSQPHLGLTADAFQALAEQIDRIYHNGAAVNLAYPYQTVRAANVLGTQTLLRLATQVKLKPIAYVSTLSVFSGLGAEATTIAETTDLSQVPPPSGGYARSKWVAENLLWSASDRGVPVAVYRPGRILGHQQTGICNTRDRLSLMLRGCLYLGCAPAVETLVDMTPVDYISQAIVQLSLRPTPWGQAFHLCNPQPVAWCDLVQQIQALGYPLQLVSYEQWQQTLADRWRSHLQTLSDTVQDHPLYPLMILFADAADPAGASVAESLAADDRQFDCQNTCTALSSSAISYPAIDPPLLQRYLTYFSRRGFFKLPEAIAP